MSFKETNSTENDSVVAKSCAQGDWKLKKKKARCKMEYKQWCPQTRPYLHSSHL